MATPLVGQIEQFDPDTDDWLQYVERLEQMFAANDLTGEGKAVKRRSIFLSVVGKRTYGILRSLLAPERPPSKTLEELTATLTKHFSPPPSEVISRFRFYSRMRQPGESVSAFIAELRKLTEYCNFGDSLNKALRDRIVGGINHEATQKKLLSESDLTYKRAVEIAQGIETSTANLREIQTPLKPVTVKTEPVHKVTRERDSSAKPVKNSSPCPHCGTAGHSGSNCRFKDKRCH